MSGFFKKNRRMEASVPALSAEHDETRRTVPNVDGPVANGGQKDEVAIRFPVSIAADGALSIRAECLKFGEYVLDRHHPSSVR